MKKLVIIALATLAACSSVPDHYEVGKCYFVTQDREPTEYMLKILAESPDGTEVAIQFDNGIVIYMPTHVLQRNFKKAKQGELPTAIKNMNCSEFGRGT